MDESQAENAGNGGKLAGWDYVPFIWDSGHGSWDAAIDDEGYDPWSLMPSGKKSFMESFESEWQMRYDPPPIRRGDLEECASVLAMEISKFINQVIQPGECINRDQIEMVRRYINGYFHRLTKFPCHGVYVTTHAPWMRAEKCYGSSHFYMVVNIQDKEIWPDANIAIHYKVGTIEMMCDSSGVVANESYGVETSYIYYE